MKDINDQTELWDIRPGYKIFFTGTCSTCRYAVYEGKEIYCRVDKKLYRTRKSASCDDWRYFA